MSQVTLQQRLTAEENGVSYQLLNDRLRKGWSIDQAITEPPKSKEEVGKIGAEKAKEMRSSNRSSLWTGSGGLLMCPVPECGHIGTIITKVHCRIAHEMEREEVQKLYGMPFNVKNKIINWEERE